MNNILPIGTVLRERYTIIETLSSDTGFGITYKVVDKNLPTKPIRVLKQLKKPTPHNLGIESLPILEQKQKLNEVWDKYLNLFEKEATALAKLGEKYNQIPTIHEQFAEAGEYFYVQEYIDVHPLTEEVKPRHKLSEKQTIALLIEILEVFEYIQNIQNNQGYSVIHRDIKPENIIRRSDDQKLVIIDFGLVKEVIIPGTKITSIFGGTKGYIAPEIALGIVSFASDIYSIGMIGAFAVTGENPSSTPTLAQDWQTKANVSPEFAAVLNKMVYESYKQRFQNAQEALQAFRNINKPPINLKLIIGLISGIVVIIGVVITVISLSQKSVNQLIADGKAKAGELTSSDQQGLANDRYYDVYTFKSERKQYLTVQVVGNNFQPVVTVLKPNDNNFKAVRNVSKKDNDFTASIVLEPGTYQFKVTSEKVGGGSYEIKGWVTDVEK